MKINCNRIIATNPQKIFKKRNSGPVNAAEAKQRMMAMEQQLSQLSQMVTKVEDGNKIF